MPTVEGLSPQVLWTTMYGVIAICVLFMVFYKVYDAIRNEVDRKRKAKESREPDFAERVSKKVLEELEPRFQEIERNLAKDKSRLDNHEKLIVDNQQSQRDTKEGLVAICKALLVITSQSDSEDDGKFKEAHAELTKFLAGRL